jgi:hypothetical protein
MAKWAPLSRRFAQDRELVIGFSPCHAADVFGA